MVLYAVEYFNGGKDVVIKYSDNKGNTHMTTRKVKNGSFKFDNETYKCDELEEYGIVIL